MAKHIKLISRLDVNLTYSVVASNKNYNRLTELLKHETLPIRMILIKNEPKENINWDTKDLHEKFITKITLLSFMEFLEIINKY